MDVSHSDTPDRLPRSTALAADKECAPSLELNASLPSDSWGGGQADQSPSSIFRSCVVPSGGDGLGTRALPACQLSEEGKSGPCERDFNVGREVEHRKEKDSPPPPADEPTSSQLIWDEDDYANAQPAFQSNSGDRSQSWHWLGIFSSEETQVLA